MLPRQVSWKQQGQWFPVQDGWFWFAVITENKRKATMISIVLALCLLSQTVQNPSPGADSSDQPDYVVGAGDVIYISVFGLNDFEQIIRVSNSGKIHVPHLGILKVHGLTPSQIEAKIATALIERELVKEPWVQVRVMEYRAHPVYVLGEVQQAGQFLITGDMTVLDLIGLAGAFNDVYSPVGYLYRYRYPGAASSDDPNAVNYDEQEVLKIEFSALYDGSHPEMNVHLRGGDILYVPQRKANHFFVVGDVARPGAFEIAVNDEVFATQAIAKAGGPLKTAKMSKGILVRFDKDGGRQETPVDFQAILRGKESNLPVFPNDIIYIPGSSAKTLGYGLIGIIPGVAEGVALVY
jgi:polysaccharide export outer membrane protein